MIASYNLELLYLHLQPNYNQFNYSTMAKITKEAALLYHSQGKPGKIEVVPTKPYSTQTDLSLAYSPVSAWAISLISAVLGLGGTRQWG